MTRSHYPNRPMNCVGLYARCWFRYTRTGYDRLPRKSSSSVGANESSTDGRSGNDQRERFARDQVLKS